MQDYIEERVIEVANHILQTHETIRQTAANFGISRSCVHHDLRHKLPHINNELYEKIHNILEYHKANRHLLGGISTREKYRKAE